ncbi:glycoside hydrolase family 16 protein [Marinifilum caeruleilacunae]|uniref:Glycosyl hydrolase family protein n=1 Tax=Marinifilum caeruleilacunae TaxID=2499076 RepID=A0ABX1WZQ4_9BACT|nr:glycoside hydrolase family 16 protein [Marinifilum caeruleilacunae]NOU61554.1 glycosyl hydrolase family protein [Marinifilum caeruleilacunae]
MGFFLASKLRKASNTVAIEKKRDELRSDFEEFEQFSKSDELKQFNELELLVLSDDFKRNKKMIEGKSFKKSELFQEERAFKKYQRSRKFKTYFRLKDSSELSTYNLVADSEDLARFKELELLKKSSKLHKKENAEEIAEYKRLKSSARLKEYFKFQKSRALRIYKEMDNSAELEKYYQLEERISSEEFKEEKAFLLDKKRFEKTEDFKKLQEYEQLKSSEKFVKYFKLKNKNPFEELKKWELTFSEEFDSGSLDGNKWITRYFWGDKLMDKGYSLETDLHTFTDGENVKIAGSSASLIAKKESKEGLVWNPSLGFVPKKFDYTSAIINTGNSFRQKYGRFEAKIKVSNPAQVQNAFWMVADKSLPHIDVFKTLNGGKIMNANFWGSENAPQKQEFKVKGIDLSKGYFIYTLDWSANELIWKINDVPVKTQTTGVPQDSMYLNFSVAVKEAANHLNAAMEIDWIRCYQRK